MIGVEHRVPLNVKPKPDHRAAEVEVEVEGNKTMIERVEEYLDIKPDRLIGNIAYRCNQVVIWNAILHNFARNGIAASTKHRSRHQYKLGGSTRVSRPQPGWPT